MKTILKIILVIEFVLCVGCHSVPCAKEKRVHCEVNAKSDDCSIRPPSVGVVWSIDKTY